MSDNRLPRTSTVLRTLGLTGDSRWLRPEYSRAGRYIHVGAALMAAGHSLDTKWYEGTSGSGPRDTVIHEECRPKLNGYAKFQRDHKPKLIAAEQELVHPVYGYSCHPDQLVELEIDVDFRHETDPYLVLLELKSGMEMDWHELQIASYMLAVEHHYKRRPKPVALYLEPDDYRLVPLADPWRACQEWIAYMAAWHSLVKRRSRLVEVIIDAQSQLLQRTHG